MSKEQDSLSENFHKTENKKNFNIQKEADPSDINVLVVEDTDVNRMILTRLLKSKNFKVKDCKNGLEALEILKDNDFHVVLMDVEMPVMDGLTATRKIREREKKTGGHIPIIAITARRESEECFAAGMDAYIPKPTGGNELFSIIFEHYKKCKSPETEKYSDKITGLKLEEIPVFNKDKVLENMMGDSDLLNELVKMFSLELPDFTAKINEFFAKGDLCEIRKNSHRLKGAAGFSGACRIEKIAQEIQHLPEDTAISDIEPFLICLEKEKNEFLKVVNS